MRGYITKNYGPDYLPKAPVVYRSSAKNAQEAHEAIRPTSIARTPESVFPFLNDEQRKLYEMIWKRAIASPDDARQVRHRRGRLQRGRRGQRLPRDRPDDGLPRLLRGLPRGPGRRRRGGGQAPAVLRDGRRGEDREALRRAALHPAAAALLGSEPGEGARAVRHRAAVDLRLDHLDAPEPRIRAARQEALHAHGRGPRREQVPHRALRPLGRLRVHRQARGRARRHLQRQGRVGPDAGEVLEGLLRADRGEGIGVAQGRDAGSDGRGVPQVRQAPAHHPPRAARPLHRLHRLSRVRLHAQPRRRRRLGAGEARDRHRSRRRTC